MIIHLEGEVNSVMFDKLSYLFSKTKGSELIKIYLSSDVGGYTATAEAIVDLINSNSQRITLIAYGAIYSAGFIIFFKSSCKRVLLKDTTGMAHFSYQPIDINETGNPSSSYDKFAKQEMKKSKTHTLNFLTELGLDKQELNIIKKGDELYMSYDRLKELLNGESSIS